MVHKTETCWLWTGSKKQGGYGRFWNGYKLMQAHRFAWEIHYQQLADQGLEVCHHCDNPPCVRPDHLFIGTRSENQRDSGRKGRNALQRYPELAVRLRKSAEPYIARGEEVGNAKVTPSDVMLIRTQRMCGIGTKALAEQFGLNRTTIQRIVRGDTWHHLPVLHRGDGTRRQVALLEGGL